MSERAGRPFGCFLMAAQPVGKLDHAVFWHLETFPNVAAAEKAKSARGAVLEAFDRVWLLTIADDAAWRSPSGEQVAAMELTATGTEIRKALVVILHESGQPHTTLAPDLTPKGLCTRKT